MAVHTEWSANSQVMFMIKVHYVINADDVEGTMRKESYQSVRKEIRQCQTSKKEIGQYHVLVEAD